MMIFIGLVAAFLVTVTFLNTIVESISNGPLQKVDAVIPNGKIKIFYPNIIHRVWIIVDLVIVYMLYLFIISFVELLSGFTICSWYFTRKKRTAIVKMKSNTSSHQL